MVDDNVIEFDTAWSRPMPIIDKLASMYPNLEFYYTFAEEQCGYYAGYNYYENGECIDKEIYEEYSKEAYELYFELWGCREDYEFNEETQTYEYIE